MKANTDKYQGIMFGVKPDRPMSFTVKRITFEYKDEVKLLGVYIGCLHFLNRFLLFAKKLDSKQVVL